MFYLFLLLVSVQAYLEETISLPTSFQQIAVSDNCTVYSSSNGTKLIMHDSTQVLTVDYIDKNENYFTLFHTTINSEIIVVNNACDLVLFGYPTEDRVALWRPREETITYIVPEDMSMGNLSNEIFDKEYNISGLDNVTRIPISNTVARFGFSLDIQGQTWVVGAPGRETNRIGEGGSPGYAFVFEGNKLHSCKSMYEMSCYPNKAGCVSGLEEFVKYYGKLNSPWASMFIPAYSDVKWKKDVNQLDITDVSKVQKLCLPLEIPFYKTLGQMNQQVYDEHREVFQQFGYAVALSGTLHSGGSALYISAPGDTSRFMEDNSGENYGRVYVWDNVIWPLDSLSTTTDTVTWWQPQTPLKLPLEIAAYQAFGRDIAVSRSTLAISAYPLYEETHQPFIILYNCNPEQNTQSNCEEIGGISIDDIRGLNPLDYLNAGQITYMDGKKSYVPAADFQNAYIGKNIGVVGSNIIVADSENNNIYRFSNEGEWREQHKLHSSSSKSTFGTNSEHWVAETGEKKLTHYWSCAPGHTGPRHQCIPAQHAYYSDDGWELYSYPCLRNFTTTESGRSYCDPWSAPIISGPTWAETVVIMGMVISTTVMCCILVGLWQLGCVSKDETVPNLSRFKTTGPYGTGVMVL